MTSRTMKLRWHGHTSDARKGKDGVFWRAIRKYGPEMFTHELLERMSTEAGAKLAERLWIERLGTQVPNGYNMTPGGDARTRGMSGRKHSPETIAKMKARAAGRDLSALHAARRGAKASTETLAKMRAAKLGTKHSLETRARMSAAHRAVWAVRKGISK